MGRLAWLVWALPLLAGEPGDTQRLVLHVSPLRGILTAESAIASLETPLLCVQGEERQRVDVGRNCYSRPVRVRRGEAVALHALDAEGGPGARLAWLEIPRGWEEALVVVDPEAPAREDGGVAHELVDMSPGRVPPGCLVFRNELEHIVQVAVEERELSVAPGEEAVVEPEGQRVRVRLEEQSGRASRVHTTALHRLAGRGTLVLVRADPGSDRRMRLVTLFGAEAGPAP